MAVTPSHFCHVTDAVRRAAGRPSGRRRRVGARAGVVGDAIALEVRSAGAGSPPALHTVVGGAGEAVVEQALLVPRQKKPPLQVAELPAPHWVVGGAKISVGQTLSTPLQLSAWSQVPFWARHSMPEAATASAGQTAVVPLQTSSTSQRLLAARQTVPMPDGVPLVLGHSPAVVPSHLKFGRTARYRRPRRRPRCWRRAWVRRRAATPVDAVALVRGHALAGVANRVAHRRCWRRATRAGLQVPSQVPPAMHFEASAAPPQAVPAIDALSIGHIAVVPSQVSTASHRSVAARQTVPIVAGWFRRLGRCPWWCHRRRTWRRSCWHRAHRTAYPWSRRSSS